MRVGVALQPSSRDRWLILGLQMMRVGVALQPSCRDRWLILALQMMRVGVAENLQFRWC